ncbi:MAG: hypothetical protein JW993_15875 [Sedimentisphaerales bacterium]|nr:hypothetical protein [Sedimentisphaerales bacterium]
MSPDSRPNARIAGAMLVLLSVLLPCGCASRSAALRPYMHPERLYLQDQPYRRLYVEIDRMEGADLPDYLIDELKAFLGAHCLKPGGIKVVSDPPLPQETFASVPLSLASILCIEGPPADEGPQPAYLHVFVYDGKRTFKGARRNPRIMTTCPSAVFWNVDYARSFSDAVKIHMLRHELGHVLGLCQNTAHGDGAHCSKYGCLMYPMPDWLSQLGGAVHLHFREHRLCEECRRDLELARQTPRDEGLSFAGPFLVRKADGYSVASLPFYDAIIGSVGFDWTEVLSEAKTSIGQTVSKRLNDSENPRKGHRSAVLALYGRPEEETDPERLREDIALLSKAIHDFSPEIRRLTPRILQRRQEALARFGGNPPAVGP